MSMPPPSKNKKIVLDEDTYEENLTKIVRNTFYPDAEKYKAQLEYMDALEKGDLAQAHTIQERLNSIQRKQTPGATPLMVGNTPLPSPGPYKRNNPINIDDDITKNETVTSFQNKYTNEDDHLFEELHKKDLNKHHKKFFWIKPEEIKYIQNGPDNILRIKNDAENKKPEIVIQNTRIRLHKPSNNINSNLNTNTNSKSTTKQKYDIVSTPLPDTNDENNTITTWGEIESTPLLLDSSLSDLCDIPSSPYRLSEDKKSDKVRDKLIKNAREDKLKKRKSGLPKQLLELYERKKKLKLNK